MGVFDGIQPARAHEFATQYLCVKALYQCASLFPRVIPRVLWFIRVTESVRMCDRYHLQCIAMARLENCVLSARSSLTPVYSPHSMHSQGHRFKDKASEEKRRHEPQTPTMHEPQDLEKAIRTRSRRTPITCERDADTVCLKVI